MSPVLLFKVVCIKNIINQVMKNDDLGGATIKFFPGANLNNGPREKDTLLLHGMRILLNFVSGAMEQNLSNQFCSIAPWTKF